MKISSVAVIFLFLSTLYSCENKSTNTDAKEAIEIYNAEIGIGKYKSVELNNSIDSNLVKKGDELYMQKCASCHHLASEEIVGPGWDGITKRREAVWLMNLMTNTEEMLEKDPELQKQITKFKTQMPDFGLTGSEARAILEFMRENDNGAVNRQREMPSVCKHLGRN